MARQGGLGRGLGALIPPRSGIDDGDQTTFQELPIGAISPNQRQPRTQFDEEALAALTASVRELGVLQPVLVRATGGGSYELIAGERRWRAAKRAGLSLIPAIVRTVDDTLSLEQALVENVQREDLNPLDEAAAYQQLLEDFHLTHDELASRVGKSRAAISNTLRLFQLPPDRAAPGGRGPPHRRPRPGPAHHPRPRLPGGPGPAHRHRRHVGAGGGGGGPPAQRRPGRRPAPARRRPAPAPAPARRLRPPGLLELEELLSTHLDTRVAITMGGSKGAKGKVTIEFATLEDLERIYRAMTPTQVAPD